MPKTTKKTTTKKGTTLKQAPKYQLLLTTVGEKHRAEGKTLVEAIANFGLTWKDIKQKGVLQITKGKLTYEHLFPAPKLRRLLGNKMVREMWAKNLDFLLKSKKETNVPEKLEI